MKCDSCFLSFCCVSLVMQLWLHLYNLLLQSWKHQREFSLGFLETQQVHLSVSSMCSSLLIVIGDVSAGLAPICLFFRRVLNWTRCSKYSLTSAQQGMIITSLDLLAAVLIMWLWDEVNLHHCDWVLLSHVQLLVHEEPRPFSAKKSDSPQPVSRAKPCSSAVPGAEKLHLAHKASVSSFLHHLKIPLNNGSAPQHTGHCSNGMSSAGWQRKPPGLLFMLLIEGIKQHWPQYQSQL